MYVVAVDSDLATDSTDSSAMGSLLIEGSWSMSCSGGWAAVCLSGIEVKSKAHSEAAE